ncbi:FkbM family methyltransferase [Rhodovulum iodosum]|uniref:FkbM family methyltransferase n=1 Tax=Rhodovulum iodosum TaxID=68291 RepID=UPI001473E71E|nr:FkbM family methyltransferase [Rhodovulum robiginosum]
MTRSLFAQLPRELEARTAEGYRIPIDSSDYHGRILWLFGNNDWKVTRTACALLHKGDVLLDIGANHGTVGFAAAQVVGPTGAVHFFEPQPDLVAKLRNVISENGLSNHHVHDVALFESEGSFEMAMPEHHSGMATIVGRDGSDGWTRKITVRAVETESYLRPLLGDRPFGVKIDVEGAEPNILPGLFRLPGLQFVVFEGDRNKDLLADLFRSNGFAIFGLSRTVFSPRVKRVTTAAEWDLHHDFVAVPAARTGDLSDAPLSQLAQTFASRRT